MLGYRMIKKVVNRDMDSLGVRENEYYACRKQGVAALCRDYIRKCRICGRLDRLSRNVEGVSYGPDHRRQHRPCCPM